MTTLFIRHNVGDYATWRRVYDGNDAMRKKLGVTANSVYRDANDSGTVIVTHSFKDISTAKAFISSKELRSAMELAGVTTTPEVWFGEHS